MPRSTVETIRSIRSDGRSSTSAYMRKKVFRAPTGVSLQEQAQLAAETHASGSKFLTKINQIRQFSKQQKKTNQESTQKYDWIREARKLKRLEDETTRELNRLFLELASRKENTRASATKKSETQAPVNPQSSDLVPLDEEFPTPEEEPLEVIADEAKPFPKLQVSSYIRDLLALEDELAATRHHQQESFESQIEALKNLLQNILNMRRKALAADEHDERTRSEASDEWINQLKKQLESVLMEVVVGHQMLEDQLAEEATMRAQDQQQHYQALIQLLSDYQTSSKDTSELLQSIGAEKCPNRLLVLEIQQQLHQLIDYHHKALGQLEETFVMEFDQVLSREQLFSKCGGWKEEDHMRYMKVFKECEVAGIHDNRIFERLGFVLRDYEDAEIALHDKWYRKYRFYHRQKKEITQTHDRKKQGLLSQSKHSIDQAIEQKRNLDARLQELSDSRSKAKDRHDKLQILREQKEYRDRIIAEQERVLLLEQQEKERQLELKRQEEHRRKRQLIGIYKESLAVEREIEAFEKAQEMKMLEETKRKLAEENSVRVEYRKEQFEIKKQQEKVTRERREQEELARKKRMDEIAETTPYAERIANIQLDPERARGATAASEAVAAGATEGLGIHETGLFPTHGYDCEKLFKDARFKLGLALREAGLNTSGFAKDAMARISTQNSTSYRARAPQATKLW